MEVMVQSLTCRVFGVADSPFIAMSTEGQVITCKGNGKILLILNVSTVLLSSLLMNLKTETRNQ